MMIIRMHPVDSPPFLLKPAMNYYLKIILGGKFERVFGYVSYAVPNEVGLTKITIVLPEY
jgi:hypothetical protein